MDVELALHGLVDLYEHEAAAEESSHTETGCSRTEEYQENIVQLTTSVSCKSTRNTLQFYAANEGQAAWSSKADFIALIFTYPYHAESFERQDQFDEKVQTELYNGSRAQSFGSRSSFGIC